MPTHDSNAAEVPVLQIDSLIYCLADLLLFRVVTMVQSRWVPATTSVKGCSILHKLAPWAVSICLNRCAPLPGFCWAS